MASLCRECEHDGKCVGLPYCGGLYFVPYTEDENENGSEAENDGEDEDKDADEE